MDGLERALTGLALTPQFSSSFHTNTPELIRQGRIYSVASTPAIHSVVTILRDYIFEGITHSGPYDNVTLVGIYEKFNQVLTILYGDDQGRTLGESRTLACIALELYEVVRGVNDGLADEWRRKLARDARMDLEWEWHQLDFRETDEDDATKLEARTAMFADLYSKGLVCASLFGATLNYVLKRATTPELYTVLFRCFIMRALTETAPKIPGDRWKVIRERWFEIERSFDTSAYRPVNDVLFVFGEDAQVSEQTWCGSPFCEEVEYGELEEFCESLVWDAKGYVDTGGSDEGGDKSEDGMCVDMGNLAL